MSSMKCTHKYEYAHRNIVRSTSSFLFLLHNADTPDMKLAVRHFKVMQAVASVLVQIQEPVKVVRED